MRAARMHGYKQPLVLEDVAVPDMAADEVLIKVTAAGMCRTDAQLVDGYFKDYHPLTFPMTPGHEIAGAVEKSCGRWLGRRHLPPVSGRRHTDLWTWEMARVRLLRWLCRVPPRPARIPHPRRQQIQPETRRTGAAHRRRAHAV
jgi:hypothetical protein